MANFFGTIASGFVWLGKEIAKAADWLPKLITLTDDVEQDASTLLPELTTVIDDVAALAKAAIADSGSAISAAEALVAAISTAVTADAINIAADATVLTAFETFIKAVTTTSNYADVLAAVQKLTLDFDTFGASANKALKQLEADAAA